MIKIDSKNELTIGDVKVTLTNDELRELGNEIDRILGVPSKSDKYYPVFPNMPEKWLEPRPHIDRTPTLWCSTSVDELVKVEISNECR